MVRLSAVHKVVLLDAADNSNNISIGYEQQNASIKGFPIANKDYDYNAYIKVNDELKWSDTYKVRGFSKTPRWTHSYIWRSGTNINTDDKQKSQTVFGITAHTNMVGKTIEISLNNDAPISFAENRQEWVYGSNFIYNDETRVNPEGIMDNAYYGFQWKANYAVKEANKVSLKVTSQSKDAFVSGFEIHPVLNIANISKMNLKDGDKIPVVYNAKIKNDNGSVMWEGQIHDTITFVGSKSFTELTQDQDPVERPAIEQPKKEIEAPNTGFAGSNFSLALVGGFSALVIFTFTVSKIGKLSKVKF